MEHLRAGAEPIEQIVLAAGADVSAETCVPRWDGHSMDLELSVGALVDKRDQARRAPLPCVGVTEPQPRNLS